MKLSKPVSIGGTYFKSIGLAAATLGVDNNTITNRIKSSNFIEYFFTEYKPPEQKVCSLCNKEKLITEFKKVTRLRDGRSSWCKKCWSNYVIKNQDKEKQKINNKRWGASEKGRVTRKCAKESRRANETNSKVDLTIEEIKYIKYLHTKVRIMRKYGFDVHLDHIIPVSKGGLHIPENLQIIPAEDNQRKSNRLVELKYWDKDNDINDQTFNDPGHFELVPNTGEILHYFET